MRGHRTLARRAGCHTPPWIAVLLALSPQLAFAQADTRPRTPVEGGALIMPEHAPPPRESRNPEPRPVAPAAETEKAEQPPPSGKKSRQTDCKGKAAHCRQDSAR